MFPLFLFHPETLEKGQGGSILLCYFTLFSLYASYLQGLLSPGNHGWKNYMTAPGLFLCWSVPIPSLNTWNSLELWQHWVPSGETEHQPAPILCPHQCLCGPWTPAVLGMIGSRTSLKRTLLAEWRIGSSKPPWAQSSMGATQDNASLGDLEKVSPHLPTYPMTHHNSVTSEEPLWIKTHINNGN